MLTVRIGNLFDSEAQTLVNTVNCVGVMGKGIALDFKNRFPDMYEDYVVRCHARQVRLGQPYLFRRLMPPWVLNFPTKDHWRSVSRLTDIETGLRYLLAHYRQWGVESLAVPPLGCGQGNLEWRVVGPTLYRYLKQLEIPVELYAPFGTAHEELAVSFLDPAAESSIAASVASADRIGAAWVALVEILRRIEDEPCHWPVGRTTFQKVAYFATQCGIPTGLTFQRGSYGPYAPALKKRITALVHNGLIREERLGQMFAVRVGSTFAGAERAYRHEIGRWNEAIEKVTDLFIRMRTDQAEIAATVHFAARELLHDASGTPTEAMVLERVMAWKQRRRPPLNETQVALSIRSLNVLSWLRVSVSSELPISDEELLYI
jgi:O-acetyl-ADP-ribose deacetylase (regulator of RNase III)/uncharacterized protein YwgA